ncbi:Eukaryotic translation initiation factor 5B [Neofusicoccum parvum]|uniref:Eukaryotic translation initiation factor 5B n=1 Tax=Neofusicoccum parvum TaxID=310453 RepID=A0ACB5RUN7_9PEZI|nr:Eukaryotic translation initiation factor 5B [Neofusicoccum parvum]GME42327.1 Eukaryotic translation initiation factor 5B [Neofusicoccum parvum]
MPPKKKGGKKAQQDDWEAELGETIDPIAAATEAAKQEEAAQDAAADGDETGGGGGGLLAALRKNKGKRVKKGKVNDFVEGEDAAGSGTQTPQEPEADLAAKAPEEANMDDDDLFGQPVKKGKGGKAQQQQQKQEEKADGSDDEAGGRVKSKKEKEREKKEREKQRKKENAAKKKTAAPTPAPKAEPAKVAEAKVEAAPEPEKPGAGGKKKKLNPALLALQKQQEERKRLEEEQQRLAEEERKRIEEEEKLAEEEEKKKAEARAAKKQKEKEKIEQLKREGKYLTKAQKEAQRQAELRMKQMIESGAKVAGLQDPEAKKKPTYDKKKKGKKQAPEEPKVDEKAEEEARKKLEELKLAKEQEEKAAAEAEKARKDAEAKKAEEEDDDLDDWEALADKEEGVKTEDVKDSWDAESEDEDSKPAANGKPNGKNDSAEDDSESEEDSEEDSEDDSDEEARTAAARAEAARKAAAAERRKQQHEAALAARSKENLRSPICCILGHVDTGKTKLLDKIRQTNVQEGEAGGITQQIGATYFPVDALKKKTAVVNKDGAFEFKVPGLLVIDTPGHESFTNLRSRGSSLCNIAILVVDIMHGLEPQTLESMRLLRDKKTPFIVALNKIDRLYGWKKIDNNGFRESLSFQNKAVQNEFKDRLEKTKLAFAEQGFNAELFYENKSMARNVSLVPTSAHTGEGIPDMLKLITTLTQERMTNSLMYLSEVEATVLEVKVVEGLGTTIDVILSNGVLHEGDRIVLCGTQGPIATNIRALLTPAEMKELRIKSAYVHNKEIKAAMGVKIAADGLDTAVAGSRLMVVGPDDDEEDLEEEVMGDLENLLARISKTGRGVSVQASTLGSLEALLEFLRVSKIPVANISIGPVFKRDIMQCGTMLEKAKEYAVMLCFDVRVDKEAREYAEKAGIKIFEADIIYHLFDSFTAHMKELEAQRKEESKMLAVFPCVLRPVAVFNKKDPIVVGVDVIEGNLKLLTPICAVKENPVTKQKEVISLGRVQGIERDHKQISVCKKGQPSVAIKIEGPDQPLYGRHLEEKDILYSLISRKSIDTLKEFYRSDVSMDEWALIKKLKPLFDIP